MNTGVVSKVSTAAFLLRWTEFTAMKGSTKYLYSNVGTNIISAAKIMDNLEWKMITKVAATKSTRWKVDLSGKQGRVDHALLSQY